MSIFKPKPYFKGGWENKVIIVISELLDKVGKIKLWMFYHTYKGWMLLVYMTFI